MSSSSLPLCKRREFCVPILSEDLAKTVRPTADEVEQLRVLFPPYKMCPYQFNTEIKEHNRYSLNAYPWEGSVVKFYDLHPGMRYSRRDCLSGFKPGDPMRSECIGYSFFESFVSPCFLKEIKETVLYPQVLAIEFKPYFSKTLRLATCAPLIEGCQPFSQLSLEQKQAIGDETICMIACLDFCMLNAHRTSSNVLYRKIEGDRIQLVLVGNHYFVPDLQEAKAVSYLLQEPILAAKLNHPIPSALSRIGIDWWEQEMIKMERLFCTSTVFPEGVFDQECRIERLQTFEILHLLIRQAIERNLTLLELGSLLSQDPAIPGTKALKGIYDSMIRKEQKIKSQGHQIDHYSLLRISADQLITNFLTCKKELMEDNAQNQNQKTIAEIAFLAAEQALEREF